MYNLRNAVFDIYTGLAPARKGFQHFGAYATGDAELERDKWYAFLLLPESYMLGEMKVTTSADTVAGAKLQTAVFSGDKELFPAFFNDVAITTAVTSSSLVLSSSFISFKPTEFALKDSFSNLATWKSEYWNDLALYFKVTAASALPAGFKVSINTTIYGRG